jgi:hypothetical protein
VPRKRESSVAPIQAGSQRRPDILGYCEQYLKSLAKLYEATEEGKLEAARQAISIWWYLWAERMLWAQSHLAGYEMLLSSSGILMSLKARSIRTRAKCERSSRSHSLRHFFPWATTFDRLSYTGFNICDATSYGDWMTPFSRQL